MPERDGCEHALREQVTEIMAEAMRPTLGPEWVKWKGGAGIAGQALDALEQHGFVLVDAADLERLYECAKSYDVRIPEANGGEWANQFRARFEDATP